MARIGFARRTAPPKSARPVKDEVADIVSWLKRNGTKSTRDGMARYGIPSDKAFGVSVGAMKKYAKQLGKTTRLRWRFGTLAGTRRE